MVRFCPGAEGGRIADVVFELGAGKAFVANHYLPGREGAFDSAATARSSALSGASSTPTGSPSGELEEVEAEAALDSGGSRAEATLRGFPPCPQNPQWLDFPSQCVHTRETFPHRRS